MKFGRSATATVAAAVAALAIGASAIAAGSVQIGASGKTYASSNVSCATNPSTGSLAPVIEAGLQQPKANTKATVSLNGANVATVSTNNPATSVWLGTGTNTVTVSLSRKTTDSYTYSVTAGTCLADTSGNTFSPDGTLEYGASRKSYATVAPGCALNPATGLAQPYVNLFDNGTYLLNVSVNGVPLTQLSSRRPHTPVFLNAGLNVISAANGSLSTDYYIRDGGSGSCTLP